MKNFRTAIVVLVALVLIALAEMGRTAVNRAADYREMTAPKSLHQLSQEAREDTADRSGVLLLGAGVAALALLYVGVVAFAFPAGREFGRAAARRRRPRRRAGPRLGDGQPPAAGQPLPSLRVMPPAQPMRSLPAMTAEEGHYEEQR